MSNSSSWLLIRVTDVNTCMSKTYVKIPASLADFGMKMAAKFAPGGIEGLWDQAIQLADEGLQLIQDCYIPPPIAFSLMLWRSKVLLEQGDFQAVSAWLESIAPMLQHGSSHLAEEAQMGQARLYQLQGKHSQALALLEPVVLGAEASGRIGNLIPLLLLQALSLDAQDQSVAALERVGKCLTLAQPERDLMTFRDEGPQVEKLIRTLRSRDLSQSIQAYADEVLQFFAASSALLA